MAADHAALDGPWAAFGRDVGPADRDGPTGLIDDDVAFATPWCFDPARMTAPVLVVQGGFDRVVPASRAHVLTERCPRARLWPRPADGHIPVLAAVPVALDRLLDRPR